MQIEQKKTLTEECWITVGEGESTFDVKIDYPLYPHNATLVRLAALESVGNSTVESYWAFYVRSIVRDYRNLFEKEKEYHPVIEKGLLSVKDFDLLMQMGVALTVYVEARKHLDISDVDKKKS